MHKTRKDHDRLKGPNWVLGSFRPIDDVGQTDWKSGGNGSGGGFDVVGMVVTENMFKHRINLLVAMEWADRYS